MIRTFAKTWSKLAYIFKMEQEAGLNETLAKVQQQKATVERKLAADKTAQADAREARIKEMAEMEEKGYWECENGHEIQFTKNGEAAEQIIGDAKFCPDCGKPTKLIKRSEMTGQERYESDKGRKESEDMLAALRLEIEAHEKQAGIHDTMVEYFMKSAAKARAEADDVRRV